MQEEGSSPPVWDQHIQVYTSFKASLSELCEPFETDAVLINPSELAQSVGQEVEIWLDMLNAGKVGTRRESQA